MRTSFPRFNRFILAAGFIGLSAELASATDFSFQGVFNTDDQVQFFTFSLVSTATVTALTYSYAGGTNSASTVIPAGGFDPILTVFDATGVETSTNNDGGCSLVGTGAGGCLDSYDQVSLSAGTYTLALTENDNTAIGPNLSNGFSEAGNGDFTGPDFGCSNGVFCDAAGDNQNGNWAVDILNVATATPGSGVPEPGTIWLLSISLASAFAVSLYRRRKINAPSRQ